MSDRKYYRKLQEIQARYTESLYKGSRCKKCNAKIKWLKGKSGNYYPVNSDAYGNYVSNNFHKCG